MREMVRGRQDAQKRLGGQQDKQKLPALDPQNRKKSHVPLTVAGGREGGVGPRGPTEQELGEERSEEGDSGVRRVGMRGRRAGQPQTPSGGRSSEGMPGVPV